jgi:alpha-tubulin suppressor-like RCC1 family protein
VSAGAYAACATLASGEPGRAAAACWGYNYQGQLGDGLRHNSSSVPVAVEGPGNVAQTVAGGYHGCVVLLTGAGECWGDDYWGQIGNGAITSESSEDGYDYPQEVLDLTNIRSIAAADVTNCALLASGRVVCWGDNGHGELGNGAEVGEYTKTLPNSDTAVEVLGLTSAIQIGTSSEASSICALTLSDQVFCWGDDEQSQLGVYLGNGFGGGDPLAQHPVEVNGIP